VGRVDPSGTDFVEDDWDAVGTIVGYRTEVLDRGGVECYLSIVDAYGGAVEIYAGVFSTWNQWVDFMSSENVFYWYGKPSSQFTGFLLSNLDRDKDKYQLKAFWTVQALIAMGAFTGDEIRTTEGTTKDRGMHINAQPSIHATQIKANPWDDTILWGTEVSIDGLDREKKPRLLAQTPIQWLAHELSHAWDYAHDLGGGQETKAIAKQNMASLLMYSYNRTWYDTYYPDAWANRKYVRPFEYKGRIP